MKIILPRFSLPVKGIVTKLILILSLLLLGTASYADMYKYVTKDGRTVLTNQKLKGNGNRLVKIYRMKKKYAYKSSRKKSKKVRYSKSKRKYSKHSRRYAKKKRTRTNKKNRYPANMVKANGRDNGIIAGCNSSDHLSKQARIYQRTIQVYSRIYDVDEELVHAIVRQESCFNEGAHSRVGAIGLMQLMPYTALSVRINDPWNPEHNIQGGIKYIAQMLKRFKGNPKLAIAAYNAGPGNVSKYNGVPPFKETRNYVKKVYAEYKRLKAEGIQYYPKKIHLAAK